MKLLTILTFIVGPVETWPTNVISAIFLQEPTLASVKIVAAFFFGNGVPYFMAHQFYFLINFRVFEQASVCMRLHYVMWQALRFRPHMGEYFNTTFKKMVWINGSTLPQTEFVEPEVMQTPIGTELTGQAMTVRFKLYLLRDIELFIPF
jgi:hypothetical protein